MSKEIYLLLFGIAIMLSSTLSCSDHSNKNDISTNRIDKNEVFDRDKWLTYEDGQYPYRDNMLHDVVYNDTIRTLDMSQIKSLLGDPGRSENNHWYYLIAKSEIGSWILHSKSMVIKFKENQEIEWIKIHE